MSLILQKKLSLDFEKLSGDWIKRRDKYDADVCNLLSMKHNKDKATRRYWDASWNNYLLEFKKGRSIWLDLVRYSEILLKQNANATKQVFNLFFIPNEEKEFIEKIICVDSNDLIKKLNLNNQRAKFLLQLKNTVPHQLNSLANLTVNDLLEIKPIFIIH